MELKTIAYIRTDFPEKFGIPRQSGLVEGLYGRIEFLPEYKVSEALRGIDEFSHLWILWGFSECDREGWSPTVKPPRLGGKTKMGVFATRSPYRPNSIGLSCVRFERITDENIIVSGIDMLDNTPIYDIKPYLPYADCKENATGGFGDRVKEHLLDVVFIKEFDIDENDRINIKKLLEQDPRTAFIHDENRVWGIYYSVYNVKFTVKDNCCTVTDIERRTK